MEVAIAVRISDGAQQTTRVGESILSLLFAGDDDHNDGKKLLEPGRKVKERCVVRCLASGSFGEVYATVLSKKKELLKTVRLTDSRGEPLPATERARRLGPQIREAHVLSKLGTHPNLVALKAAFSFEGVFCLVLDGDDCTTLAALLELRQTTVDVAAHVTLQAARGLYHVEQRGFTLWDFKPANVIVALKHGVKEKRSSSRLPTFGSAASSAASVSVKIADLGCATATGSGVFYGYTPAYGSPETHALSFAGTKKTVGQVSRAAVTQDAWSLGVTLMEMLLGQNTWKNYKEAQVACHSRLKQALPLGKVADACYAVVQRCLADDASRRLPLDAAIEELRRALGTRADAPRLFSTSSSALSQNDALHNELARAFLYQLAASDESLECAGYHLRQFQRIRKKKCGAKSPQYATALNNLAALLWAQGKHAEARPLVETAVAIDEKVYGRDHPELATDLNNLAGLLEAQGEYDAAKAAYERSLGIRLRAFGESSADVAQSFRDLALLLWRMGRLQEAIPLQERAMAIRKARGGDKNKAAEDAQALAKLRAGAPCPYKRRVSQFDASVLNPLANLV